jgi:hypothetical protein
MIVNPHNPGLAATKSALLVGHFTVKEMALDLINSLYDTEFIEQALIARISA